MRALKRFPRYISPISAATQFMLFAFILLLCGFQAASPLNAATTGIGWGIAKGALAGILAAYAGWASQQKSATGVHEPFDVAQAAVTALIGAGFGAFAAWKNMSLIDAENMPLVTSVVSFLEILLKTVWRNSKISIQKAFGTVQTGTTAANPTPPAPVPKPPGTP